MKVYLMYVFVLFSTYPEVANVSYGVGLTAGDIILLKETGNEYAFSVLRAEDNYRAEQVLTTPYLYEPVYDVDHVRDRVYLERCYNHTLHYLDLKSPPYVIRELDFLPDDTGLICAARDGSCLILDKLVAGDIYAEENPVTAKPRPGVIYRPYMLFKYDLFKRSLQRLTYFYSNGYAWLSNDGDCISYIRFGVTSNKNCGYTFVFSKSDGTSKFDLAPYLRNYLPELDWVFGEGYQMFDFIPHPSETMAPRKAYLVYLQSGWPPEEPYSAVFEYYTALVYYEGPTLKCDVDRRTLCLPEGLKVYSLSTRYSNGEKLYLEAEYEQGVRCLCLYELFEKKFKKIPGTEDYDFFIVY
jgi:hypothetical protein